MLLKIYLMSFSFWSCLVFSSSLYHRKFTCQNTKFSEEVVVRLFEQSSIKGAVIFNLGYRGEGFLAGV